eukprot:TRINITY_DN2810_c0_g2_i2.p1 TRINITY_DN2810_c0_g2~~TRINITY_DN2810_c0_g2_i2.p1  ORF type:complete len:371 (-),score=86.35 TRINITY_DN2810_c0_g2_i2:143-1162(-)
MATIKKSSSAVKINQSQNQIQNQNHPKRPSANLNTHPKSEPIPRIITKPRSVPQGSNGATAKASSRPPLNGPRRVNPPRQQVFRRPPYQQFVKVPNQKKNAKKEAWDLIQVVKQNVHPDFDDDEIFKKLNQYNFDENRVISVLREKAKNLWSAGRENTKSTEAQHITNTKARPKQPLPNSTQAKPNLKRANKQDPKSEVFLPRSDISLNQSWADATETSQSNQSIETVIAPNEEMLEQIKQEKMKRLEEELKAIAQKKEIVYTIQKELENLDLAEEKRLLVEKRDELAETLTQVNEQIQDLDLKIQNAEEDMNKLNLLRAESRRIMVHQEDEGDSLVLQ